MLPIQIPARAVHQQLFHQQFQRQADPGQEDRSGRFTAAGQLQSRLIHPGAPNADSRAADTYRTLEPALSPFTTLPANDKGVQTERGCLHRHREFKQCGVGPGGILPGITGRPGQQIDSQLPRIELPKAEGTVP